MVLIMILYDFGMVLYDAFDLNMTDDFVYSYSTATELDWCAYLAWLVWMCVCICWCSLLC